MGSIRKSALSGLYVLNPAHRKQSLHPFVLAQQMCLGSYVSAESAFSFHGWIPESVHTVVSMNHGGKSVTYENDVIGKFEFRRMTTRAGYFLEFGIALAVLDKQIMDKNVRTALIKDTSIASQLNLRFYDQQRDKKLTIKLEIDTNPPFGSGFEYTYLSFPVDYEVCHQDLESNCALKVHALLCKPYLKGRDWYDFSLYVGKGVAPRINLVKSALLQHGLWRGQDLDVDRIWLANVLRDKISAIDWQDAAEDVARFLTPIEQASLKLWSERFFLHKLERMNELLRRR
ncbi:nucleotidyl transferase AbiEii/AbiGii toxin family protein [Aequoribacter sp.]|uniref:nucleotidyl transferase AbiEii/AbiGii toxin family protein n=1 Tax=Aequoribacter sp. TaxID=2847771 RepID=UPI003F69A303